MSINQPYEEKDLLRRIGEGDERAFTAFYEHYYNIIRPFVARNVAAGHATDEILQMTFLRVWLNRHKLEEIENVKAWVIRIASREYLTYVRDRLSKELKTTPLDNTSDSNSTQPLLKSEQYYTVKEIRSLVAQTVKNLSPQRRQIFQLSRNEQLTVNEIAARLQLSPKTVKNTLTAALNEIRKMMELNGYDLMIVFIFTQIYFF